jgi:hypothetical protein
MADYKLSCNVNFISSMNKVNCVDVLYIVVYNTCNAINNVMEKTLGSPEPSSKIPHFKGEHFMKK